MKNIKGIIFDYGGTIDSNGLHWAEVIWEGYQDANVAISKEDFRQAYVHGERTLGKTRLVLPEHTFGDMLDIKIGLQLDWLAENIGFNPENKETLASTISHYCYRYAKRSVNATKDILTALHTQYPMVLVSNFYGNIEAVLKDFELDRFFNAIVESAVVGIRKPDPAIFCLGLKELSLPAAEVVVIGDSHDKDILPAKSLGCQTIWLKRSIGWTPYIGDETADAVIKDFKELQDLFELN